MHEIIPKEAISGLSEFLFRGVGAGAAGPYELSLVIASGLGGFAGIYGFVGDAWAGVFVFGNLEG